MSGTAPDRGDLYREICETSNEGIWVVDADARTIFSNPRLAEMLGYSQQELLGMSLFELTFPEDHSGLREKLEARRRGERSQHDFRFRRKCGMEMWAIVGANPLFDADGKFRGMLSILTDVTERYTLERRREDSRGALRSLFECNPDGVYVLDLDGNLLDINAAVERMVGYSREELFRMGWQPLVAPESHANAMLALKTALDGHVIDYELTLIVHDGRRIPVAGTSFPLRTHGIITGVYGIVRDISARKRLEDNLQFLAAASQALVGSLDYRETLNHAARVAVPMLGDWCVVASASTPEQIECAVAASDPEVHLKLRHVSPDLISANSVLARVASGADVEVFDAADDRLLKALAGNGPGLEELRGINFGTVLCAPLRDHGRRRGVLLLGRSHGTAAFSRDTITLAQDLAHLAAVALENAHLHEELRRADTNKDHFLTTLGHELRNPLAAIRSATEVLKRAGLESPAGQRALLTIERQVRHESRLLEDLLNVSRIARGKVLMRFERVDLTRLLRNTLDDYLDALDESGLVLEMSMPSEPVWVTGDPTRLAQVFANLLHNAVKFTDRGGTIRVVEQISPDRHWVHVHVEDTGIGIEPALMSHLFELFTQDEHTRERSRGGLGLGLALVKGLIEIHGGEVRARSDGPGKGSCFTFELPLETAPETTVTDDRGTPVLLTSPSPHRVLVIDDNRAVVESMSDLLQLMGYAVDVAFSGPEGLQAAAEFAPHAVLCDLGLPGLNGYQVARELRQDPAHAGCLLIAITGEGCDEAASRALDAGFDHYLLKPFEPAELLRLLTNASLPPQEAAA